MFEQHNTIVDYIKGFYMALDMTIAPNEARSQEVYSNVSNHRSAAAEELLKSQVNSPEVQARLLKIMASNKESTV